MSACPSSRDGRGRTLDSLRNDFLLPFDRLLAEPVYLLLLLRDHRLAFLFLFVQFPAKPLYFSLYALIVFYGFFVLHNISAVFLTLLQLAQHRLRGFKAVAGVIARRLDNQPFQPLGTVARLGERLLVGRYFFDTLGIGGVNPLIEVLIHHHSQRIHVPKHSVPAQRPVQTAHLGCHSAFGAGRRHRRLRISFGDAEIPHQEACLVPKIAVKENVFRLDVAVQDFLVDERLKQRQKVTAQADSDLHTVAAYAVLLQRAQEFHHRTVIPWLFRNIDDKRVQILQYMRLAVFLQLAKNVHLADIVNIV